MENRKPVELSEEELAQVRKAMEDFGAAPMTPVTKAEMEEDHLVQKQEEIHKAPVNKRKVINKRVVIIGAILALVVAIAGWLWSERYWLLPNPMSQRKNTVSIASTCMYLMGEDGNLYFYDLLNRESTSLAQWDDVLCIDTSAGSVIGLQKNGTVKCLGDVEEECLQWKGLKAVATSGGQVVGLRKNGTVVATGTYEDEVRDWRNIVGITTGNGFVAGLHRDGTVVMTQIQTEWLVKGNVMGEASAQKLVEELEKVKQWEDIVAISAYDFYIVGLRRDGTVVAAGLNIYGECDVENWKNVVSINAGQYVTVGVCSDGSVLVAGERMFYDGTNEALTGEIRRLTAGKRVVSAYGTRVDIYVLCDDGVLYCIGQEQSVSINLLGLRVIMTDVKLP